MRSHPQDRCGCDNTTDCVQNGSSSHLSETAILQSSSAKLLPRETCVGASGRVYSEHYSAYAGCASARPPGADTRRPPPPPPLAGVGFFVDFFCIADITAFRRCGM